MPKPTLAERFAATLSTYTGGVVRASELKVFQDPKVSDCYAVRYVHPCGETYDALFTHGVYDDPEQIEDAEFESWPPTSGELKFFI